MKKLLKFVGAVFAFCIGLGFIVGAIEKKLGKVRWTEGHKPNGFYEKNVKRPLDLGLSLFALILLWPVMAVTAVLARLKLGKPVLFKQQRPGLEEKVFTIRKFRTMTNERGEDGQFLTDELRLIPYGKFLRSTSLDELPELFNIVKGDMSIIGPRPLLVKYLPRYNPEQHRRHDVRPGLTGYAQVHGRNDISWTEKFKMDVWYVDNLSFRVDVGIFFATIGAVFKRNGISSKTSATMEEFMGNEESL